MAGACSRCLKNRRAFGFCALVVANLALILSNRSHHVSLLASLRRPNRTLWIVTSATAGLLLLAVAVPALAGLFRFAALPWSAGLMLPALAVVAALWFELMRRGFCAASASSALAAAVGAVCGLPPHVFGGGTIAIGLPARRTKQVARHVTRRPGLAQVSNDVDPRLKHDAQRVVGRQRFDQP